MPMGKQYLKMADAFNDDIDQDDIVILDCGLDTLTHAPEEYAAHAINSHDELVAENERLRTALECATNHIPDDAKMVIPEGWKLVPKVPTRDMITSGNDAMAYDCCSGDASDAYQAMLASAPKLGD